MGGKAGENRREQPAGGELHRVHSYLGISEIRREQPAAGSELDRMQPRRSKKNNKNKVKLL